MYCDNKSAIALCCNNVQHSRSKHIDIRFHFIKEHVENGVIELYLSIHEYQLATSSRKLLAEKEFNFLINKAGNGKFYADTLKQFGRLKLIIGVVVFVHEMMRELVQAEMVLEQHLVEIDLHQWDKKIIPSKISFEKLKTSRPVERRSKQWRNVTTIILIPSSTFGAYTMKNVMDQKSPLSTLQ
ncbi:retrotransposon protein, putative, unclassified [Tanacetum coccineum]